TISLKLTQMGLDVDEAICLDNLRRILAHARQCDNFVRIDMESSAYVQRTLDLYFKLRDEGFTNVGVVIQSYLYRSADDMRKLAACGTRVRIVKGAYDEPSEMAFAKKPEIDQNFRTLVECMWAREAL